MSSGLNEIVKLSSINSVKLGALHVNKGSSLIETLVALFILAIGLLGVISMQAISLDGNQRSTFSTEAYILATDMADQIYASNNVDTAVDDAAFANFTTVGYNFAQDTCNDGQVCVLDSQVDYVKSRWAESFAEKLPAGIGTVDFNAASSIYTIKVMWDADKTGATGTACGDDKAVDLSCYVMEIAL